MRGTFEAREVAVGALYGAFAGVLLSGFLTAGLCYLVDVGSVPGDFVKLVLLMHAHLALLGAAVGVLVALVLGLGVARVVAGGESTRASRARSVAILLFGNAVVAAGTLWWFVVRRPTVLASPATSLPPVVAELLVMAMALRALRRAHPSPDFRPSTLGLTTALAISVVAPTAAAALRSVVFAQPVQADAAVARGTALTQRVLLVGWDGATWDVIDPLLRAGELPNLARLIAAGTRAPLPAVAQQIQPFANSASAGMRTPALWETISTGKSPEMHGIWDFESKIVMGLRHALPFRLAGDYLGLVIPTTSDMARSERVWHVLDRAGVSAAVVGWYSLWPIHRPLGHGAIVSDRIGDRVEAAVAPADAVTLPPSCKTPPDLLGLLGINTKAELLEPDVERDLVRTIRGDLRDDICNGNIALDLLARKQPTFTAPYFSITDIAQHKFWRFYEPEVFEDVDPRLVERYRKVIPGAYRFLDSLLGRLVAQAGDGTTVILVSDHGAGPWVFSGIDQVLSGSLKSYHPDYSGNHRVNGIIVMAGPAVRVGAELAAPQQVDIAPTILRLLGVAVARDMRGRALTEALVAGDSGAPGEVASYQIDETLGSLRPTPSVADRNIEERLRALGYIQ